MTGRRFAFIAWGLTAALAAAGWAAGAGGLVINPSPSLPMGLWRAAPPGGPIARGAVVVFCPPETPAFRLALARGWIGPGRCPGGSAPLLKPVAAIAGDAVEIRSAGVFVNGRPIANSAPQPIDGLAAWPEGLYRVAEGEVWLVSGFTSASFDSRYFGPVEARLIEGVARPVWTRGADRFHVNDKEQRP